MAVDTGDRRTAYPRAVAVHPDRDAPVAPELHSLPRNVAAAEALELPGVAEIGGDAQVAGAAHRILGNRVRRRERADVHFALPGGGEQSHARHAERHAR